MPGRGRGARGGARGGRGGRFRGRGRSRGRGQNQEPKANEWDVEKPVAAENEMEIDVNTAVQDLFTGNASFDQHYKAQEDNRLRYAAAVSVFKDTGLEMSQNARVRALTAAWSRKDHELVDGFLENRADFGLVEVLKAVTMLDAGRQIRAIEKVMKQMLLQQPKSKRKVGKLKCQIDNLGAIKPKVGSASGSVCTRIKKWTAKFSKEELEFFALFYPAEPWKKLADICHFNPDKDFPAQPWFLSYCFGKPAPEGSMVERCKDVTKYNVNDLLKEYDIPYSHIKQHTKILTAESKGKLAATDKLDTILWYYEDLQCPEVDAEIDRRLSAGEKVTLNNGKLLERLLTLKMIRENIPLPIFGWGYIDSDDEDNVQNKPADPSKPEPEKALFFNKLIPHAQERLDDINLPLETPIVVIGDRSGSMDVAVRTSTIIASIVTAIAQAKLVFFNEENMEIAPDMIPKDVDTILEMAVNISAVGGTAPAVSLFPFYEKKEVVKTFIVVTDEEENEDYNGHWFADLYKKYHDEVYPAKLVFVSFLNSQHAHGKMVEQLKEKGFNPHQFKLDSERPDLSKLDNLFALLSSKSQLTFEEQIKAKEAAITADGVFKVLQANASEGKIAGDQK